MSINIKTFLLISTMMLIAPPILAATPINSGSDSNSYMFIENSIDNEYFITTAKLAPRLTGANVWTKYPSNQEALGYMGWASTANNRYVDFWITNSPILQPFVGIRCRQDGGKCPSIGHIAGTYLDNEGFYHTMNGDTILNGNSSYGTLSSAAFEYFRSNPVGTIDSFVLNFCFTTIDYDYNAGLRCKDLTSSTTWRYYTHTVTKLGHLKLNSTNAMSEIMVASDGIASVEGSNDLCSVGVVGTTSGVICKMVSYSLQQTQTLTNSLTFKMVIDTALLGFTPAASDVQYSGDGSSWTQFATPSRYMNVFTTDGQYVYVFLSNNFFRKVLSSGNDLTNKDSLFTFAFENSVTPTSGYYQFTASSLINIIPREYGISIVSSDGISHPSNSGNIGDSQPIEFDYKLTTSASRMADSITAQVVGDSTTINGVPYCLFTSADGGYSVPIPAFLSYISQAGATVTQRNSCGEGAIDITKANWVQTAWNAAVNDGFFFTTSLKLKFPMNDSRSQFTTDGNEWMGTVSASGEVKVTATWIGVDR